MSAVRLERQHSLPQGQPVFHTGERQHVSTAGSLAPLCGCAAQGLRSAKHCFRSSSPSMPHDHAAGTRRSRLATLAPPAVKVFFNTILQQGLSP